MTDAASNPDSTIDPPASGLAILAAGVVHAIVAWLAFPVVSWWWLAFVAPAPLAWAAVRAGRRRVLVLGVGLPMVATWMAHQWWVGTVSGLGLVPMCLYLAGWTPIVALVIRRLARSPRLAGVPLAVLVPMAWLLTEALRAEVVFDGYPWYLLGQPLVEWPPLAQVADLGGVLLVSMLPAMVAGVAVDHFVGRGSSRRRVGATVTVAVVSAAWVAYGIWRVGGAVPIPGPTVMAVQTDLPQSNKVAWSPEDQWRDANDFAIRTLDAFRAAAAERVRVDLVAWPETMLPGVGLEEASTSVLAARNWWPGVRIATLATELQGLLDRPMLLGSTSFDGLRVGADDASLDWDARHNSVYLLDESGIDGLVRYDKIFLTPFGETMPYISSWPWLESRLLDLGARGMRFDLMPGDAVIRFEIGDDPDPVRIATPICFEDTVPWVCRRLVHDDGRKVVDLLVNASNDGWFGTHDGARRNHLQSARFRCIENRVPMIRAANTGISAWIDSNGLVRASLPSLEAGVLIAPTELDDRRSPYAVLGGWPVGSLATATGVLLLIARRPPAVVEREADVG